MLTIWKSKWKTSHTFQDRSRSPSSIGGADLTVSGLESNAAVPPSGEPSPSLVELGEVWSSSSSGALKRLREEEFWSGSNKRTKVDLEFSNFGDDDDDEVLEVALKENTIFAASSKDAANAFLAKYITRIWEDRKGRKEIVYPVVIVDAPSDVESSLQAAIPDIMNVTGSNIEESERKVLLLTSSSLLHELTHGSLELNQIGSLVFGELPFSSDRLDVTHPILRIMKRFYAVSAPSSRPMILAGLFASSTDFTTNVSFDSLVLEANLHCKIHGLTAESRTMCLVELLPSVRETVVVYDPPNSPPTTPLVRQLRSLGSDEPCIRRLFKNYQHALAQLGSFAAGLVCRQLIDIDKADSLPPEIRQSLLIQVPQGASPEIDMASPAFNVTPKVLKLVQILKSCRELGGDFCGIIFVRRRIVADTLMQLLLRLDSELGFLRIRVLFGARNLDTSHQDEILRMVKDGSCNLLIATKSVEDLDLPNVPVLIKFDLFDSQLSHAHALSHCLGANSHIISMVERGNGAHHAIISHLSNTSPRLRAWTNAHRWTPQSSIPDETLYTDRDPYSSDSDEESESVSFIRDSTTGSRMYPQDALNAIYPLCSTEREPGGSEMYNPLFEFDVQDDGHFVCRVRRTGLLQNLPMPMAWSSPNPTKAGARRLAAYDACAGLYHQGLLDSRVFPRTWATPSDSDPLPALNPKIPGTRTYPIKSPAFWPNTALVPLNPLTRVYPMIISVNCGIVSESLPLHAPLVMLVRQPLPDIPDFNVFFAGIPARISLIRAKPIVLNESQLQDIHAYNTLLWRAMLNKSYPYSINETLAHYVPLTGEWSCEAAQRSQELDVSNFISWKSISATLADWVVPLKCDSVEALREDIVDALIQDRWAVYTRRYDTVVVRPDLNPLSKPLDPELQEYENLLEYCKANREGFEGLKNDQQPLLEVVRLPPLKDRLQPAAGPFTPSTSKRRYFIPELCAKVTVPASTFRTVLLLPCIMRRINDFLLVKELNSGLLDYCVSDELLHVAISPPSAGIEYDYERLELLGDAFLKLLSSIYVFVTYPKADESSMHNHRQALISNKSLWKNAIAVGLPSSIRSRPLSFKGWSVPRTPTSDTGEKKEEESSRKTTPSSDDQKNVFIPKKRRRALKILNWKPLQHLGDKVLADVVEAIMGAALLSGGTDAALKAAKALNVPLPNIEKWADFGKRSQEVSEPVVAVQISSSTIGAIEAIIGCPFKRPQFLIQALTHKTSAQSTTYERLEFIGDAILDFMVIRHLFHRHQQMNPGMLTVLKGAMVSNTTLAALCVLSGLHHHLLFGSDKLAHDIREYENLVIQAQNEEYAAAEKEGRPCGQFWHNIESPKVLGDLLESILGALYVSDEYSPVGAEAFFDKVFEPFYNRHITLQTLSHHPTKTLFEFIQSKGCGNFSLVKEANEYLVLVHDVVLASTQDENGISGAKVVSSISLCALEGDPGFLARTCNCWKDTKW
ncbi:hypothetical protein FB446DRAFT_794179 [Lentinula raphanica]|nr:hypothetical protein FB446DRAFT_794179 [Lentinula raphanica]